MHKWVKRAHFVGIGGVGMSGIAEVLFNLDYQVSGSDRQENANTRRLAKLGIDINIGHDAAVIKDVDVVVVSSAVDETNVEVKAARQQKVPVIPRAEMLGELMRLQHGIAIAGTHGKTTTTSFASSILAEDGMDPTFVIGGKLNSAGANARLGKGEFLVAEADESDASFLHLQPYIAVVTNIDADHMETYDGDISRLRQTFVDFLHNLPFYGLAILCIDDPGVCEIRDRIHKPILTYGTREDADVRASNIRQDGSSMQFDVVFNDDDEPLQVTLNHPGQHNVLNALAAIAVAHELGVKRDSIVKALNDFAGIGRRFQMNGVISLDDGDVLFVDDYAHHPRELQATIDAARNGWPDRRLVVVFQPHRYSRTKDLMDDFSAVLSDQDPLLIAEVYAAGEEPVASADGRALCGSIRARGRSNPVFVEDIEKTPEHLQDIVQPGDLVLTMGAGNIGLVAAELPKALEQGRTG